MAQELSPAGFDEYNTQLQASALQATRHAVALPSSDLAFHRSLDRSFGKELDACSSRVLSLTNKLLSLVSTGSANRGADKGKARKLENEDDVVDHFHSVVVDRVDELLERADISLDEFLGRSKPPAIAVNPAQPTAQKQPRKTTTPQGRLDPALQHASHLAKPQLLFKRKPDNSNLTIWKSTLRHKYNAQVPLGYRLHDEADDEAEGSSKTAHPYRYEITHLAYPARQFVSIPPIQPRSFADTPFTWVDTPAAFSEMLQKLRGSQEIAIDLEYHSYRTFGGFVCLMQLSTREEDFVVDTLAVREEMEELNEVFTDPNVVKVLHGAESDIVWLQQDFNLYIVNLFDTYHASKVLEFPRHNLATLLEMYCDFTADKRYQLADWRIRPLPQEMLNYARSDTHFLLFIYDHLRNALLDRAQSSSARNSPSSTPPPTAAGNSSAAHALVNDVLARSAETSLRVYEKERYDAEGGAGPGGWDTLARKWNKGSLTAEAERAGDVVGRLQRAVYRCVHAWRDRVAREEDESVRYVLPNHHLFQLADHPPADMAALLSVLHPVPPVVRRRGKELLDEIRAVVKVQLGAQNELVSAEMSERASEPRIEVEEETVQTPVEAESPKSLWSIAAGPAAERSSLFGNVLANKTVNASYVSAQSTLFGAAVNNTTRISGGAKFLEVVSRINQTLVILPTVPKGDMPEDKSGADGVGMDTAEEGNSGREEQQHEERAFVRAAERVPRAEEAEADSIVVVGRKKKRKRVAVGGSVGVGEGEAFDYSAVSNILDEGGSREEVQQRKKKPKGAGGYFYGDFPAPPKAASEVKKGNTSRTFK